MLAIFTGEVNGLTNLVVRVANNVLQMVENGPFSFWRFDLDSGKFETVQREGGIWAATVVEMSGRDLTASAPYIAPQITMAMVDYKLSPAE